MAALVEGLAGLFGLRDLVRGREPRSIVDELKAAGGGAEDVDRLGFVDGRLTSAIAKGKEECRFVAVLLFSGDHDTAEVFAREVITHPEVMDILQREYILWGASVNSQVGLTVSRQLGVSKYPFLSILYAGQNPPVQIESVEGFYNGLFVANTLKSCIDTAGALLVSQRADKYEAEARRALQEEQEAALREAERVDRERQAEEDRKQREAEEALRREREEREAAERAEAERVAALQRVRTDAAAALGEEPDASEGNLAVLRVTLFDGSSVDRRFRKSDAVAMVENLVRAQDSYDGRKFAIAIPMPAKTLTSEATLEAEGLFPRARVVAKEVFDS
eukprot:TRINITY_DN2624_c0_g2_i1.p1 TRINITY_DN2624_c0_g2~~TRINITY_DN2624_c0_g2_i1.p1  ORF type:complete len:334 (+),score=112.59 TRINITY_DN2624_c0_g2_i1:56-1057(+)